jgi:hypothetical protein
MTKTASAKTNGHSVDAIRAVATRAAPRAVPKPAVKAAARAPAKVAAKTIKAPARAPAKAAAKAAVKAAPAARPVKAAARKTAAAPAAAKQAAARPAARAAAKVAAKPAVKKTPKAVSAHVETEREKLGKPKLVRDSFTMPEQEYAVLAQVKKACLKAGFEIKKSELLRIGVALISKIGTPELKRILADLPQLKTGRPKNS